MYTTYYEVSEKDLPLHCPPRDAELWNSHPRVFLDLRKQGRISCPYCGAEYILKSTESQADD